MSHGFRLTAGSALIDACVFVCGDWWDVVSYDEQSSVAAVVPPGKSEVIRVYVPPASNTALELAECVYMRHATRPESGSLWRASASSQCLGHKAGDVILVVGPAADGHGIECDNSSGPVVYPDAWWYGTQPSMTRVE